VFGSNKTNSSPPIRAEMSLSRVFWIFWAKCFNYFVANSMTIGIVNWFEANTNEHGAFEIATQIRTEIENTEITIKENKNIHFTVSGGISFLSANDNNIEKLLDRADKALYLAKKSGRNQITIANFH
jgi:hypothetical protein